jgi:hypothetical protein
LFRLMASNVSTFSGFVANGRQALQHVSSSPSKIPYVGFSPVQLQTGIPPRPSLTQRGLSARPTCARTTSAYTWLKPLTSKRDNISRNRTIVQAVLSSCSRSAPVQRPLAHQKVMLSCRVIAYYGLIRNSRPSPSTYGLYDRSLSYSLVWAGIERNPNLLRLSLPSRPPSVPRRTIWLPLAVPSPSLLAFAFSVQARHPQPHTRRFSRGKCNESAEFALCYGPEESLALHRQGRLLSSFHLSESPHPDVEYDYAGKQPIPAAGLTPAGYAALWAANGDHRGFFSCHTDCFLFLLRVTHWIMKHAMAP